MGHYVLNVEEDRGGEMRVGSNVALGGGARVDVGLLLRGHIASAGGRALIHNTVEMTSREEDGSLRKMTAQSDVIAAMGSPTTVAAFDEPTSHRHYDITVSARRQD